MKKKISIGLLLCFSMIFSACTTGSGSNISEKKDSTESASNGYPIVVKNYNFNKEEKDMEFKETPKRVISTNQTTTELLLDLGLEESMVGTSYRDNPILDNLKEKYDKIPVLSEKYPSKEVVIEKNPDLIIGWKSVFADKALGDVSTWNEKGVNTFIQRNTVGIDNATVENVYKDIEDIGKIFNIKDKTDKYIDEMKSKIDKIQNSIKDVKEPVSVLVMEGSEDNKYTTYGNKSLAADMVAKAGGKNLAKESGSISVEDIVGLNPDVIVLINFENQSKDNKDAEALRNHTALSSVNAIKNDRIIYTPLAETYAGGARTINGIERLAKGFYPEIIK